MIANKKSEIISMFILFIFIFVVFFKIIFTEVFFFGYDGTLAFYPVYVYIFSWIKKGIFPLWSSDLFCGYQISAQPIYAIFYPLNILFLVFGVNFNSFCFFILFHFYLSGIFMYFLCRQLKLSNISSLLSATAYMFNPYFFKYLKSYLPIASYCWFPLVAILLEKYFVTKKISFFLLSGFIISFQILSCEFQSIVFGLVFLFFYFAIRRFLIIKEKINFKSIVSHFATFIVICTISIIIASVQIVPTIYLMSEQERVNPTFYFITQQSMDLHSLTSFLFRFNFPEGFEETDISLYFDRNELGLIDIFPLIFSIMAIVFLRGPFIIFLIISGISSLILSLGAYIPYEIYKIFLYIPVISSFRSPYRWLFLYPFCMSLLSGFGMNFFLDFIKLKKDTLRRQFILFISIVAAVIPFVVVFATYRYLYKGEYIFDLILKENTNYLIVFFSGIFLMFLFIILNIDLRKVKILTILFLIFTLYFGSPIRSIPVHKADFYDLLSKQEMKYKCFLIDKKTFSHPPDFVKYIQKDRGLFRIESIFGPLQVNLCLLYNLSNVSGFIIPGFSLSYYDEFMSLIEGGLCYDLLNVKYVLKMEERNGKTVVLGYIQDKVNALPRVFFEDKYIVIKNKEERLKYIKNRHFSTDNNIVVLEENIRKTKDISLAKVNKAKLKVIKYLPDKVIIDAQIKKPGFIVLLDTFCSQWKAYINSRKTKIYRTYHTFKGVYIEKPGKYKVEFKYEPLPFKIGLVLSISGILLIFGVMILISRLRNKTYNRRNLL